MHRSLAIARLAACLTASLLAAAPLCAQNKLHTFYGDAAWDTFGNAVAGAGDVNKDGYADVIVGAMQDDDNGLECGSARVLSGLDGAVLYTFYGDSDWDIFGISVAGAGDVNADGYADVIVGASGDDDYGASSGSARVFSGVDGSILYTFYGGASHDCFGISVAGAGDVNKDGYSDVIVGANLDDGNGYGAGSAQVLSGFDGSVLYTFYGDSAWDAFGKSVAGAGDVNIDGYADLIVGASGDDENGNSSGSARVLSGADGSILYTFHGDSAGDGFGGCVAGAGDVNRDGSADVIVGASGDDENGNSSGSARVLSGVDGAVLYTFYGTAAGDKFGDCVAGAGDVNQDGYGDIIVGEPHYYTGSGRARVFSGLGCCLAVGQSCTVAPCQACPAMVATTSGGAPTLNNGGFALELRNAPSNINYAILALSSSPCVAPGASYVFCDTIKVVGPLGLAAIPFTPGVADCTTNVQVHAPVPNSSALLGMALGVQWAISCDSGTVLGTSITNCVSFVVTDM